MKPVTCLVVLALSLFAATLACAQLPQWDFEQSAEGWITLDKQATLQQATDAAHVHQGVGSLQFSFDAHPAAAPDDIPGALIAQAPNSLAGAACIHLAVQTSVSGPLFFLLRETDESDYLLMSYVSADGWHVLDLPLAEFRLDENGKDENGKLDPDQVVGIGIVDPGHFLTEAGAAVSFLFYERPAHRDVWLDEVKVEGTCPNRLSAPQIPGTTMIEDCDSDSAYFMVLGGRNLKVQTCADPAVRGNSLRLDYELPVGTIIAAMRHVPLGMLADTKGLAFSVRSGAAIPLLVTVEEDDRSRYQKLVDVQAGQWQTPLINWADMTLAEESQDADPGLQPETIRSIGFVDAATVFSQAESGNTLWLDDITTAP